MIMNRKKIIRRIGYIRDQRGIMNRYIREKGPWEQHLEHTRTFIRSSFREKDIESVAVLGSGWLLDIPLEDLNTRFKQIYLVDIHHPPQIRKKVEAMKNIKLLETDLSGGAINQIWRGVQSKGIHFIDQILEEISLTPPLLNIHPDAVVSVNLLNQLDIILCEFLEKQGVVQPELIESFRSRLQAFHLQWITTCPGCLVTDTIEVSTDHNGKESFKSLLYTNLPEGHRSNHWSWDFDTHGTYMPGVHTRMEVQAIEWV